MRVENTGHRVAFLEDHCASLATAMRSVAVSVETCLNPGQVSCGRSSASSGVFSLTESLGEKSSVR